MKMLKYFGGGLGQLFKPTANIQTFGGGGLGKLFLPTAKLRSDIYEWDFASVIEV